MKQVVLASASPRRKQILEQIGLPFVVDSSTYEEPEINIKDPHELTRHHSKQKALDVAKRYNDAVIIGADTIIMVNSTIYGKPHTEKRAREILNLLSGNKHQVITGFTIIDTATNKTISASEESVVYFRTLKKKEIDAYIATGEPLDKAGAYAIQEKAGIFVKRVEGDFFNVVGLPLAKIYNELKKFGITIF